MTNQLHDAAAEQGFALHEHREVLPWIDRLHEVGCFVGHRSAGEVSVALRRVLIWLETDHEGHVAWEEAWLYPELDERAATPWATRSLRFAHEQIRAAVRRLSVDQAALGHELTPEGADELRARVFGLEALLRAHLDCEDRLLLPLLDDAAPTMPRPTHG